MAAANAKSARVAVRAADVALARVEAIHAKIEDAHAKIFQATSDSSMQPTSEKAAVAMEHCRCQNWQISSGGSQAACLRINGNMDTGFYPTSGSLEEIIPYMLLLIVLIWV